jgi:hypothetical protein
VIVIYQQLNQTVVRYNFVEFLLSAYFDRTMVWCNAEGLLLTFYGFFLITVRINAG